MTRRRFTILGCGSSGGVPRLGGQWGAYDPSNPKNLRRRCSLLIEQIRPEGTTRLLIDTSPDLRAQLLDANVGQLDGVLYTHAHADHVHGIDDLRMIVHNTGKRLDVWADAPTQDNLLKRFDYAFEQPAGSPYPPILNLHKLEVRTVIEAAGGPIALHALPVQHGTIDALGFRIGNVAYIPDMVEFYPEAWDALQGLDCLIIDALRRTPHPTHAHLEKTLGWIQELAPRHAVLTNMHFDLDYATVAAETPAHVEPAFDGLTLEYPV